MKSMTAFASSEFSQGDETISVEIKSYNSRFLDLNFFIPSEVSTFEKNFRSEIEKNVCRGKIDIYICCKKTKSESSLQIDENLAQSYFDAQKSLAEKFQCEFIPNLTWILSQENVVIPQKTGNPSALFEKIFPVFKKTLSDLILEREREGENLKRAIETHIETLEKCLASIKSAEPQMKNFFENSIRDKAKSICAEFELNESQIMQEVAFQLVKYTINEEIVRFECHLSAMKAEISKSGAVGKRLDFLCQELNREMNTIGSKNQDAQTAKIVVDAKNAIENIREQSKNLE